MSYIIAGLAWINMLIYHIRIMEPENWGSSGWFFLFMQTFAYPENNVEPKRKISAKCYFEALADMLPCYTCQDNYAEHLKKHPITDAVLENRDSLFKWLVDIRNEVRVMQGLEKESYQFCRDKYLGIFEGGGMVPKNKPAEKASTQFTQPVPIVEKLKPKPPPAPKPKEKPKQAIKITDIKSKNLQKWKFNRFNPNATIVTNVSKKYSTKVVRR